MSQSTRKAALPLSLLLSVLAAGTLHSAPQTPAGKQDYALIFGTVWGPDSRPVSGVPVRIRRASEKKFRWELTSDRRGEFAQRVPVGSQDYVIEADTKPPKDVPKAEVTVHVDDNERKDVSLRLTEQQMPRR